MELLKIWWQHGLNFSISDILIYISLVLIAIIAIYFFFRYGTKPLRELEFSGAEIGIGNQKISIKPNYKDRQIAYKLWVELSTRKIGIPIDFNHDVIFEVYNSWYEFFKITRELIKDIPVSKVAKHDSTRKIVDISIKVLNKGLRPHLTKWQARFRKWYLDELEKKDNRTISPQEIQVKFPLFEELKTDMAQVNKNLIAYRDMLKKLSIS